MSGWKRLSPIHHQDKLFTIVPFAIGRTAEGKELEPSSRVAGNRFSKAARQAVSAYLPFDRVDPPGIEPGSPVCRTGVFPLDDEPVAR